MIAFLQGLGPLAAFGFFSAVLSTFAYYPYIRDTLRGDTRPQRASWLIWSVLGSIALGSQIFEGATTSLWFAAVQVGGTIIVFVLSIFLGAGGFLNRRDGLVLLLAAGGLVAWYMTNTSAYALALTISISLTGGMVTVMKAYRDPESETMITWLLSALGAFLAVLAVGRMDPILLAYPLYLLTLNTMIVIAITMGNHRQFAERWIARGAEG